MWEVGHVLQEQQVQQEQHQELELEQELKVTWWWSQASPSLSTARLLAPHSPGVAGCLRRAAATGRAAG